MKAKDLTNTRFGRWMVLHKDGVRKKNILWRCRCDCGNESTVQVGTLTNGTSKSCGCLAAEIKRRPRPQLAKTDSVFNRILNNYKQGAKRRGIAWALSTQDFKSLTASNCHYCGDEPSNVYTARGHVSQTYTWNGVDRIDNSIGYLIGNCVPCCSKCNLMKNKSSSRDFVDQCRRVYLHSQAKEDFS
jgi:hypothetical protein